MRILKWTLNMAFVTVMLLGEAVWNFGKELMWSARFEWKNAASSEKDSSQAKGG